MERPEPGCKLSGVVLSNIMDRKTRIIVVWCGLLVVGAPAATSSSHGRTLLSSGAPDPTTAPTLQPGVIEGLDFKSRELQEETCRSLNVTGCLDWEWGHVGGNCLRWGETPWMGYTHTLTEGIGGMIWGAPISCDWFIGNITELRASTRDFGSRLASAFLSNGEVSAPLLTGVLLAGTRVHFMSSDSDEGAQEGIVSAVMIAALQAGSFVASVENSCIKKQDQLTNEHQMEQIDPHNHTREHLLTAQQACWYCQHHPRCHASHWCWQCMWRGHHSMERGGSDGTPCTGGVLQCHRW